MLLLLPGSGLVSGGAWLKVMSGCLPRLWSEPGSSVSPATADRGSQVGVIARQLPRSPDGPEHINTGILASLAVLPETGFLQGILEVASSLVYMLSRANGCFLAWAPIY